MCGGVVACAIAWPLTFGVERYATIRLPALLLTRARLWLGIVRRFGCPRHYLPAHVLGWVLCGGSVACATTLTAHVWGWALCDDTVVRATAYPRTFWTVRCSAIQLPARIRGCMRLVKLCYAHSTPARQSLTSCPAGPLLLLHAPARRFSFSMRRHASPVANRPPAIPRRPATPHMPADAPAHSPARPAS